MPEDIHDTMPDRNNIAQQEPMHNQQEEQDLLRQRRLENVKGALRALTQRAHAVWKRRGLPGEARNKLQLLDQQNPGYGQVGLANTVGFYLIGLLPLFVYVIDVLLLAAANEYLVGLRYGAGGNMAAAAIFILPACVIWLELSVSQHRLEARQKAERLSVVARQKDRVAYWKWSIIGGLLALVLPALVIATVLERELSGSIGLADLGLTKTMLLLGLILLALVCHVMMIYGGENANRAWSYLIYRFRRGRLQRGAEREEAICEDGRAVVAEGFNTYMEAFDEYNRHHPEARIQPGPFDASVREIINAYFGYAVIPNPEGPRAAPGHDDASATTGAGTMEGGVRAAQEPAGVNPEPGPSPDFGGDGVASGAGYAALEPSPMPEPEPMDEPTPT